MAMLKNEGRWDRVVRVLAGMTILYLGWAGIVAGGWGFVFRIFGFVPLITGIVGWCPVYSLVGISTCSTTRGGPPAPTPVQ